ncbi:HpcH/HpaI aldolase [Naematelia encephala]|uniref:HpcH/HpaI aldolase n=1 Tax=Naematelia encephala TaxID=71784 RepID=A0A1Y2ASD3_9TREE|nr:HpcH/HpaI aldolase [Naematelia encephala]
MSANGHQAPKIAPEQLALAQEIVRPNLVKQTMQANKLAHSFGMRIAFSTEMPLIAKRAGYTAVLMNLEHMAMGMETMKDIAVSCLNVGITPMVVVPTVAPEWISRCLDSGAQAIIVPHVNNVEQAKICVGASKFPPIGHRSVTMVTAMTQYSTQLSYAAIGQVVNDNVLMMPMIETQEGLANVESIAAVPGIDALLIGCADLCMELGIPGQYDADIFHAAVDKVAKAAEKASTGGRQVFIGLGGLEPRPDLLAAFAKKYSCIRFAMAGRDIALLLAGMSKQAAAMNELSKEF